MPAFFLVERGLWVTPDWLLNSYLDVEELELAVVGLDSAPAWFQSSHLDMEGPGWVLVGLFLA